MALFTFCVMHRDSAKRHISGGCTPSRGLWPQILTPPRFLCDAPTSYPPSFIILCLLVRKLSCWQTHPQTRKQTHTQTNRFRRKHPTFFATLRCWVQTTTWPWNENGTLQREWEAQITHTDRLYTLDVTVILTLMNTVHYPQTHKQESSSKSKNAHYRI